jgi:hypothetical protein
VAADLEIWAIGRERFQEARVDVGGEDVSDRTDTPA